jgi:hypothetical protein
MRFEVDDRKEENGISSIEIKVIDSKWKRLLIPVTGR